MKKRYIIGNWKSNKKEKDVEDWFKIFAKMSKSEGGNNRFQHQEVVICPPFVYLEKALRLVKRYNLPIKIGAQDVSPYGDGSYTGEVSASMVKEFAEYVIIGHSERREHFREDDRVLFQKTERAKSAGLTVIYCVPDKDTSVPHEVEIVAYEPVWAIGTGKAETPDNAGKVSLVIKDKTGISKVIYGGSVTEDNISDFWKEKALDGVLPGGASLNPAHFFQIVETCQVDTNVEHSNTSK